MGKTAKIEFHLGRVAALGCSHCRGGANLHHVMHMDGKECRRDDRFVVPLCRLHHQGRFGVHGLGSERAFKERYGIDLVKIAKDEWEKSCVLYEEKDS